MPRKGKQFLLRMWHMSCYSSVFFNIYLVTVISHEQRKDLAVITTNPMSFVTQIFRNGQPRRGGDRKAFEVMALT